MGICKIVNIEDLMKDNKRLCLSANRVFNNCYLCPEYEKKIKQADGTFKIKICESRIENKEGEKQIQEKERLKEELKAIKQKLKEL